MKTKFKLINGVALLMLTLSFNGCQKDDTTNQNDNKDKSEVAIRMTDAPALYTAVNVEIKAVEILYLDTTKQNCDCADTSEQKWVTLTTMAGIYNLLEFHDGLDTIIAQGQIEAGYISKMRLILGENNSVVIGTDTILIKVPSGMETGLKLNINKSVSANGKLNILFDFDANTSIVVTGINKFILKPVLKLKMSS